MKNQNKFNSEIPTDSHGRFIIRSSSKSNCTTGKSNSNIDNCKSKTVTNLADCAIKKSDKHDGLQRDADGRIIIKSSGAIREDVKANQKMKFQNPLNSGLKWLVILVKRKNHIPRSQKLNTKAPNALKTNH